MNIAKLNENIAFFRKKMGITQEEFANALGVTNQAVSKWESGKCAPDIQLIPDIAAYFNISTDELFGCLDNSKNNSEIRPLKENTQNLNKAVNIAEEYGYVCSSLLQFKLRIGYRESQKLIQEMERVGYIKKEENSYKYKFILPQDQNKTDVIS